MISTAQAKTSKCKIKVVGGSFKGRSFKVKMVDGSLIGQSGMTKSDLPGCQAKKMFHGRWYHLCEKGTLIVYVFENKTNDIAWRSAAQAGVAFDMPMDERKARVERVLAEMFQTFTVTE